MKTIGIGLLCALVLLLWPARVHAQAGVEYGLGAGAAAGMGAAASGIGKAISGIAGSLDKTVKSEPAAAAAPAPAPKSATTRSRTPAKRASASRTKPVAPARTYEDLKNLEVGLSYADAVRRFGPPSMQFATATGKSLTYANKEGMTQVEVRDGIIASIARP